MDGHVLARLVEDLDYTCDKRSVLESRRFLFGRAFECHPSTLVVVLECELLIMPGGEQGRCSVAGSGLTR